MGNPKDPATPSGKTEGKQFYIDQVHTLTAHNRKCEELQEIILKYRQMLFPTWADAENFMRWVCNKVIEINRKYPKSNPLNVCISGNSLVCYRTPSGDDFFWFTIKEVERVWEADTDIDEEGGQQ